MKGNRFVRSKEWRSSGTCRSNYAELPAMTFVCKLVPVLSLSLMYEQRRGRRGEARLQRLQSLTLNQPDAPGTSFGHVRRAIARAPNVPGFAAQLPGCRQGACGACYWMSEMRNGANQGCWLRAGSLSTEAIAARPLHRVWCAVSAGLGKSSAN